ncbi:MAG: GRAM domain-containing protein [Synechococcales bacterium]|nr:GRAM domain-containing protein [Synechococcales bacterium]
MKTPLLANESIVKQGAANLQRGLESVGGQLYLTNQRLVFEPHCFNIQRKVAAIPVSAITDVRTCWTKFLNLLPLFPNSIAVSTRTNQEYRLVVANRQSWVTAIANQRHG